MKLFLLFLILAWPVSAELKAINDELFKKLNHYRSNKYKLTITDSLSAEAIESYDEILAKLPSPSHNIPKYIWGLTKKNKEYSEKQHDEIKTLISKYKLVRSRLHDERNYCRIRMLIASYSYSISNESEKSSLKKRIKLWLILWLNYKKDEEDVAYCFAREIWNCFTEDQQQKILQGETKEALNKKGNKRSFTGEKQLVKIFKISNKNSLKWSGTLNRLKTEYSTLEKDFLKNQKLYNKSFFYINTVPAEYAIINSGEMNKNLSDIYWFHALAMERLMNDIVSKKNIDAFEVQLQEFLKNFYAASIKKYYIKGNGRGLIDLANQ